ncbi:STAS/SEC14 domain-containing protein [Porifericola rhodea]|uniref:STAS/SEC14 domain-containing protein n=1 Tax=Porifericola rhodea TaxID=930972 RepID=UPI002665846A|nr:STAS/SEC14 domain-containing protein [Porifericola rhodea]WKN30357.1 STAS/SEC14 domain-containing protein [Porifericola rhodea]
MIFFENEFAQINYLEDAKTVEMVWKQTTSSQMYRDLFAKGVEALEHFQVANWLSNTTDQGLVAPEDRKWLETQMIPTAIRSGLRNIAVVVSKDIFKRYYVDNVRKYVEKSHLSMQYFDDTKEAVQWLSSVDSSGLARPA